METGKATMVKVSVIVPVYNVEAFLRRCLDSIHNQSFTEYEVILVDDGSTDASQDIAREYADRYVNWKYIRKANGGLSSARNRGIELAKGEYICFVDSDDEITPDYLTSLYSAATEYGADMVVADYHEVDEKGSDLCKNKGKRLYEQGVVGREDILTALSYIGECHFATAIIVAWNKLVRTDIMKRFRYKEGVLHEDEFIIMPLLLACKKVVWIENDVYLYRQRSGSIMQKKDNALKHLVVLDALEERINLTIPVESKMLTYRITEAYFGNIVIWYYLMRNVYKYSQMRIYLFFSHRMWKALYRYGSVLRKKRRVKYLIFACMPEIYLKFFY